MKLFSHIRVPVKLFADVISYRIKKREMANLFAALSIMIALHNETLDIIRRLAFAVMLNALVYLINDYYDIDVDLQSGSRDRGTVTFLKEHKRQAMASMIAAFVVLAALAAFYCPGLLFPLIGGVGVCWVYSARLKRVAIADVLMMTLWGGIMPSTGISLDSSSGWILIGQLALFSSCFETIQTLRDRESDARAGFATTAVFLGERKTKVLIRVLICLAAAYCIILLHYLFGLFMIIAALIPVPAGSVEAYWNRIRLILGLTWLAVLVHFYLCNSPNGLIYATILFQ